MHVSVVVPVGRHAARLAVAAYTVSNVQVQETLLHHHPEQLPALLVPGAVRCDLHSRTAGHHAVLQGVSAKVLLVLK